jgi:D-amino-acid dehydrogenase
MLMVFKTAQGYAGGVHEAHLLHEFNLACTLLNRAETLARVPSLKPDLAGGLLFPDDAHLDPAAFVRGLAVEIERLGAQVLARTEVVGIETSAGRVRGFITKTGQRIEATQFVLAAGAWSPQVARDLRLRLPVQAGKGYSVTTQRPTLCPDVPISLAEARVAITPLRHRLRLAGTMELSGLNYAPNARRVRAIIRAAQQHLNGLEAVSTEQDEVWSGLRPCTPDGLPIIGRATALPNLIVATGHAMMGLSLGPITGQLVAQLACDETPTLDLAPLRVERF